MIHKLDKGMVVSALAGEVSSIAVAGPQSGMHGSAAVSESQVFGQTAVVYAGDYLNKLTGESIERECRQKIGEGAAELVVNFSRTEMVNSIGVSILLGIIDTAASKGARVVFADVNESTAQLFDLLGVTRHVEIR